MTILLLNYCNWKDTVECVRSVRKSDYPNYDIIIIDNNSPNDSEIMLARELPEEKVIPSGDNLGYTGGINFGIGKALEESPAYIFVLNPDTIISRSCLRHLVDAMEHHSRAATACGTIYHYPDTSRVWYAGGRMIPWRGLAVHFSSVSEDGNDPTPRRVSFVTGCAAFLRVSSLGTVGMQDERFFMYLDDIEYSARIARKGFDLLYVPSAAIYHKLTDDRLSVFKLYYSVRNRLLLINTAFHGSQRVIASGYFMLVILAKMIVWRLLKPRLFRAALSGMEDYFGGRFYQGQGISLFAGK